MGKGSRGLVVLATAFLIASSPSLSARDLSGSTSLELVKNQTSLLGLDLKVLENEVCGNLYPLFDRGAVLIIASDGGGNVGDMSRLAVEVLSDKEGPTRGTILASVRPILFDLLGGAVLALSCGEFTYRVTLDEQAVQPTSVLVLAEGRYGVGLCSGNLAIQARLILTPVQAVYPIYDASRSLALQISGRWTLSDVPVAAGDSPLVLLADREGLRVVPRPVCLSDFEAPETSLCFAGVAVSIARRP